MNFVYGPMMRKLYLAIFATSMSSLSLSRPQGKIKKNASESFLKRASLFIYIYWIRIWQLTRMLTIHIVYFLTLPNHDLIYRLSFVWNHSWRILNISRGFFYLWKDLFCLPSFINLILVQWIFSYFYLNRIPRTWIFKIVF